MVLLLRVITACTTSLFLAGLEPATGQLATCSVPDDEGQACTMLDVDVQSGCATEGTSGTCGVGPRNELYCFQGLPGTDTNACNADGADTCSCTSGVCFDVFGNNVCPSPDPTGATGDPHLVGFRGQKFDFTGEDNGVYSLVNDGTCNVVNMRVTALPGMPNITYITGLGLVVCGDDGETQHTVEIIVDDPHDLDTECFTDGVCFADGALTVHIDGEEMSGPGEYNSGDGVQVAAVNIPGECRPFGFEKYWLAKQDEEEPGRQLREALPMSDWILGDALKTNPTECKEYVTEAAKADALFDHQSEHTSFQITSPPLSLRVNHGKIHQIAMHDPTDTIDLPDHLAYQMNIVFEHITLGDDPQGTIGETVHPVLDEAGQPIMEGMEAIRGDQEDYRVGCLLCSDFSQLHHHV